MEDFKKPSVPQQLPQTTTQIEVKRALAGLEGSLSKRLKLTWANFKFSTELISLVQIRACE